MEKEQEESNKKIWVIIMGLAYGVDGEIDLELENNYGDYSNWSKSELMNYIDKTLKNMLTFMDDLKERKQVKYIMNSQSKKEEIAKDFMKEHEMSG